MGNALTNTMVPRGYEFDELRRSRAEQTFINITFITDTDARVAELERSLRERLGQAQEIRRAFSV